MNDPVWYVEGKRDISALISAFRSSGAVVAKKTKQDVYDMVNKPSESSEIPIMFFLDPALSEEFVEMLTNWRSNLKWCGPGQTPSFVFVVSEGNLNEAQKKWDPTDHKTFDFIDYDSLLQRDISTLQLSKAKSARTIAEYGSIVGDSQHIRRLNAMIQKLSCSACNLLILGESGTGKELVARAVHKSGNRSGKPFVAFSCADIPEELFLAHLFGHTKGAFTDAKSNYEGLIAKAHQGTLFLDEIGELELPLQAKLLRFLEERKIRKIGGIPERHVDVRVIAATNKDLAKMVQQGAFREDLLFRLNVIDLYVPPLRHRMEDLPALITFYLLKFGTKERVTLKHFHPKAEAALSAYSWPGNVRELENAVYRGYVLSDGDQITFNDLPLEIQRAFENQQSGQFVSHTNGDLFLASSDLWTVSEKARPGNAIENSVENRMKKCIFGTLQEMSLRPRLSISDRMNMLIAAFKTNGPQEIFAILKSELNPDGASVFDPDSRTQDIQNLMLAIDLTSARHVHTEALLKYVGYIRNNSSTFIKNRLGLNKANMKNVIPELADWFHQKYRS